MADIVGLRGPAPTENGADPQIIDFCAELLIAAQKNEIQALALCYLAPNGCIKTRTINNRNHRHELVAGCEYLKNDIINADKFACLDGESK